MLTFFRNIILILLFFSAVAFLYFKGLLFGTPKMNKELGDLYKNRSDRRRLTTKKTYPDGSYESETISFPKRLPCWCYKYDHKQLSNLQNWRDSDTGQLVMELGVQRGFDIGYQPIQDLCDKVTSSEVSEEME